ncbi:MAG: CRISPR-associated endonuclease Cas2 [Nitrososphaerota archaeon]|nr:CRISPR-associated endonuclease Cas2 [Candidatus Bathyarchaeota archaeon]MDW8024195.1 CRISPR-associated endonuclease Cas2 [Nitrososphaerota archaeon]
MFVIMVYDVGEERLPRVLGIGRRYLTWIQNSVFEGEISDANFVRLKDKLSKVIDKEHDAVTFYILRTTAYMKKENLGVVKGERAIIL